MNAQIITHDIPLAVLIRVASLDLTYVEYFWGGTALILGALWLVLIAIRVLPTFLRDTWAWIHDALVEAAEEDARRDRAIRWRL